jgi:hypothetical protein
LNTILHITPNLPPAVCGVGDYATVVGQRMGEIDLTVRCSYLAAGYRGRDVAVGACSPDWFWRQIAEHRSSTPGDNIGIVLHYSGYGYSPDGAPAWLAAALEGRPAWAAEIRIATFFHELYASGWPWQRAFWQSNRQRGVAVRIARASDALLTNRGESAAWLEQVTGRPAGSVPHLPVPSNVGEPEQVPNYFDRPPQAVVFGGPKVKRPFLQGRGAKTTAAVCQKLGLTKLVDIGKPIDINRKPFDQAGIEVVQLGYLEKDAVSQQLLMSRVGFFDYFPGYLEKSGVLAAMATHGVAPLTFEHLQKSLMRLIAENAYHASLKSILSKIKPVVAQQQLAALADHLHDFSHRNALQAHALGCFSCFEPEAAAVHC